MSRSPSADVASPVFGRFLLLVRDWNTGELLPLGRNVVCQCAMCARRRTLQSSPAGAVERPPLRRAGFTLVEMVVVLLILALLTVAAVQSLSPVADQARYDATSRTLTQLNEAMLGADSLRHYSAIRIPCGWRGPYLRFGIGVADLRDGWSNPFTLSPATAGSSISTVTWAAVSPYSDNLTISTTPGLVTVSGTLTNNRAVPTTATIVLLYPDSTSATLAVMPDTDATVSGFSFANVPVGFRALRADIDGHVLIKYLQLSAPPSVQDPERKRKHCRPICGFIFTLRTMVK